MRAAYGVALLSAPGRFAGLAAGTPADSRARKVARVLGVRHLAQAGVTAASPTARVLRLGAGTDFAHCASMLVLAAADRPRRRGAVTDAAAALAFALAGILTAPRSRGS
jgi:hypothetical protein